MEELETAKQIVEVTGSNNNADLIISVLVLLKAGGIIWYLFNKWDKCRESWNNFLAKRDEQYFDIFKDKIKK